MNYECTISKLFPQRLKAMFFETKMSSLRRFLHSSVQKNSKTLILLAFEANSAISPNCTFLDFRALCMVIEQTGGCLFQRKLTQNMDISICKNSIKESQVARVAKSVQKKITFTFIATPGCNSLYLKSD